MKDTRLITAALILTSSLYFPEGQTPRIGILDFYGLRTISESDVRSKLPFKEGDGLPDEVSALEAGLAAKLQVDQVKISAVCCDKAGDFIVWVGVQEAPISRPQYRHAPTAAVALPAEVLRTYRDFGSAMFEAVRSGETAEDLSEGHSLLKHRGVREVQERFLTYAKRDLEQPRRVLRESGNAEHRAAAAWVLGYAENKIEVVDDLQEALRDPDDGVRNNAARALAAIAVLAEQRPQLGIRIRADIFINMLNSVVWTDRNKALMILTQFTKTRDGQLLEEIRRKALSSLVEMARWKSDAHAEGAYTILGRLAGLSEDEIRTTWINDEREITISKVLQLQPRAKTTP